MATSGAISKRTRQGLKLQGPEAKKTKGDEPPAPEERKPLSERYGSACPICWEPWDVNGTSCFYYCCCRMICETCDEKIHDDDQRAPCPLCRAPFPRDDAQLLSMIRGHVDRAVPEAITQLAYQYRDGDLGLSKDLRMAATYLKRAAGLGDSDAILELGTMYEDGDGVRKDIRKAMQLYRTAAELGEANAQQNVALLLVKEGEHNAVEAVHFYKLAAAQGLTEAEYNLATCYEEGTGVDVDLEEAKRWYARAAEKGDTDSEVALGLCYDDVGRGVDVDFEEARRWYARAAAKGDPHAQNNLGFLYQEGNGVEVDFDEAKRLYELAAAQGDDFAECNLGDLYADGLGVDVDLEEAKRWYERAASQGNEEAIASIPKIERKLVRAAARKYLLAVGGDMDAAVEALRHAESESESESDSDSDDDSS